MTTFLSKLRRRIACAVGAHTWKRATRIAGTRSGIQKCRRCGHNRTVQMRRANEVKAAIDSVTASAPPKQWPPQGLA